MSNSIAESVREVAALVANPKAKPLSDVERKEMERTIAQWAKTDPRWQQKIKEVAEQKLAGTVLGLSSSLPKAVAIAIMTLLPSIGSAQEIINQVKPLIQTEQTARPEGADLLSVRKAIPDPHFNMIEEGLLAIGAPFNKFQDAIHDKIDKAMPGVLKAIKNSPSLSTMGPEQLATIISEQFDTKVKDAAFAKEKATLDAYLKKTGKNLDDVKRTVANHLIMHKELFRALA